LLAARTVPCPILPLHSLHVWGCEESGFVNAIIGGAPGKTEALWPAAELCKITAELPTPPVLGQLICTVDGRVVYTRQ
jgi:hypothetical protein